MGKSGDVSGQMKLSFGMLFSIILIVFFLAFGFYAIMKFLGAKESAEVGKFTNDFQTHINKIWQGSKGSQVETYFLPLEIEMVCFIDKNTNRKGANQNIYNDLKRAFYEDENLVFYPVGSGGGFDAVEIKNVNILDITSTDNPYCIKNQDGKIRILIEKDYNENLVRIKG